MNWCRPPRRTRPCRQRRGDPWKSNDKELPDDGLPTVQRHVPGHAECDQTRSGPVGRDAQKEKELRKAFDDFVGQTFYGQMLSAMRDTVGKPAYMYGGRAEEVFQKQLDQLMAEKLSDATASTFTGPMYELFSLAERCLSMISLLETKPQDMNEQRPDYHWDEDLAELLEDLSQVQDELLDVLDAETPVHGGRRCPRHGRAAAARTGAGTATARLPRSPRRTAGGSWRTRPAW